MNNSFGTVELLIAIIIFLFISGVMIGRRQQRREDRSLHKKRLIDEAHARLPGEADLDALRLLKKERNDRMIGMLKMHDQLNEKQAEKYDQLFVDAVLIKEIIDEQERT